MTRAAKPPPAHPRSDRDPLVAAALVAAMVDVGCSIQQLADAIGVCKTSARKIRDGAMPLRWWHVARLPLGLRVRLLERMLAGAQAARDGRWPALDVDAHVRRTTRATGELAAAVDDALADGRIDAGEETAIRRRAVRLADAATRSAPNPDPDDTGIPIVLVPRGSELRVLTDVVDALDKRAPRPLRLRGTATLTEEASFIAHVRRFTLPQSVLFADTAAARLTAVFNYHHAAPGEPAWGDHRAIFACGLSRQWRVWAGKDRFEMPRADFVVFIDENLDDLVGPDAGGELRADVPSPAAVLEMARNLTIRTKGEFSRTINATTGEGTLVAKDEHDATSTKIHRSFLLGIPVFEGGEPYRVEARIRFTLRDGRASFAYVLHQRGAILAAAFGEVRKRVAEATGLPMFAGAPEG